MKFKKHRTTPTKLLRHTSQVDAKAYYAMLSDVHLVLAYKLYKYQWGRIRSRKKCTAAQLEAYARGIHGIGNAKVKAAACADTQEGEEMLIMYRRSCAGHGWRSSAGDGKRVDAVLRVMRRFTEKKQSDIRTRLAPPSSAKKAG